MVLVSFYFIPQLLPHLEGFLVDVMESIHSQDLRLELLLRSRTGQTVDCITMSSNFRPYSEIPQDFDCLVWSHVCIYVVDGIGDHVYVYARITFLGTGEEGREMFAEVAFVVSILSFSLFLSTISSLLMMKSRRIDKRKY